MAFTTIPGSGSAATTISGTSGVDFGSITTIDNYFVGAQQGGDTIGVVANLSNGTMKGGQGTDLLTFTAGASITSSFVNTNSNNDSIGTAAVGSNFFTSTVLGGQGNDTLTLGTTSGSTVNGNKGNDVTTAATTTSSTLFGGQGNDQITFGGGNQESVLASGDLGNDRISINASTAATNTFTNNTINGGAGNDTIQAVGARGASSGTVANGGEGIDTINFAVFTQAVTINGDAGGDIITSGLGSDAVNGGAGNDNITLTTGGAAAATAGDTVNAGAGADRVVGDANGTNDRYIQQAGDSIAATGGVTGLAGGTGFLAATSTFTFANGIDVITNYDANEQVITGVAGIANNVGVINTNGANTVDFSALAAGNYLVRGVYTEGNGVFTTSNDGADMLFFQTAGGNATNAATLGTSSAIFLAAGAVIDQNDLRV